MEFGTIEVWSCWLSCNHRTILSPATTVSTDLNVRQRKSAVGRSNIHHQPISLVWSGFAGTPVQCEYGTYSSFMLLLSAARRKNVPILYNTMKGTRKDFVGWTWTTYYYIFNSRLIVGNNIFWASMSTAFVQTTECVLTDRNKSVWKVAICLD